MVEVQNRGQPKQDLRGDEQMMHPVEYFSPNSTCAAPRGPSAVLLAPRATPARTGRPVTSREEAGSGGKMWSVQS